MLFKNSHSLNSPLLEGVGVCNMNLFKVTQAQKKNYKHKIKI